jgi:hypothetical protein
MFKKMYNILFNLINFAGGNWSAGVGTAGKRPTSLAPLRKVYA